ncbi:MAG: hypothetical protein U9O89_00560 [Thermoproteota archaeon]|nr:hypothetical protein [Thermoproteota archaeon]
MGAKLGGGKEYESVNFDVNVKLEEKERKTREREIYFVLSVQTKPSVAKFKVEGTAMLAGADPEIEKMLETDPETKIPRILHKIYQHVFTALFLSASIIQTPHPPPNLLFSAEQNKPASPTLEPTVEVETPTTPVQAETSPTVQNEKTAETVTTPEAESQSQQNEQKPRLTALEHSKATTANETTSPKAET